MRLLPLHVVVVFKILDLVAVAAEQCALGAARVLPVDAGRYLDELAASHAVAPDEGRRLFQVRLKQCFRGGGDAAAAASHCAADAELLLGHGDLMTMEGLHQLFYLHSVWPGDSKAHVGHELTRGERINLTWRSIVQHLDGSEECMGMRCPLAA